MIEYRRAELMNIGTASVFLVVILVAATALIYRRCQQLSRPGKTLGMTKQTVDITHQPYIK